MTDEMQDEAILVRVVNEEKEASATFGAWVKHTFTGPTQPRQILPQDSKRKRATIVVTGTAAQFVYVGSPGQTQDVNVAAASAGELLVGAIIITESASEMWCIPPATATDVKVNVLVERYF